MIKLVDGVLIASRGRFFIHELGKKISDAFWKVLVKRSHRKLTLFMGFAIHVLQQGGKMLAIRLPAEIEKRLEELAKKTGRTKSYYVRQAILEYLEDLEDFYLAEERLRTFGEAKAIPLEEIMKRYGLED